MIFRLLPLAAGLAFAGCTTVVPSDGAHASKTMACKAMMEMRTDMPAQAQSEAAPPSAKPDDMMKRCPMMQDKAALDTPKDSDHAQH